MAEHADFDVAIVGGGLVGASLAAALADTPLHIALVEPQSLPSQAFNDASWDTRIYAVSPASASFLRAVGAWSAIGQDRITPVRRMEIHGDRDGVLAFSAYEAGVAELAFIVESRAMQAALWGRLEQQTNLQLLCPADCAALARVDGGDRGWTLTLADGRELAARLVVGADGRASWVRKSAGIEAPLEPYHQVGVVANFACGRPHENTAFQWFRDDGILAYLPLPGNRISIVWSTSDAHGEALLALAPEDFAARVAAAGAERLGRLEALTPPAAFPLARMIADRFTLSGLALIGDAAHAVHPLAGQGVNLGFADARALADTLATREAFRSCGDAVLLRRYERARREDILAMRWVTHGLQRLFGLPGAAPAVVRNFGLNLTARLGVVRNLLIRHALGQGALVRSSDR